MSVKTKESTIERVNKLREYLLQTYPEGKFSANTYQFKDVLNVNSQTAYYVEFLVKEGFLKRTKKAVMEGKQWLPAEYEIVEIINKQKKNEVIESYINVSGFIEEKFNNIPLKLIKTEIGYVMSIKDIAKALHTSWDAINKIITRNEEVFNDLVFYPSDVTSYDCKSLTRDGIIGLLMKISYQRLTPEKKKLVLDFQKWAIKKLGTLLSDGKVELTEQEHAKVQKDIGNITNLPNNEVDLLFNQFEEDFAKFINSAKTMVNTAEERRIIAEQKAAVLNSQNQKWIARTQAMMEKMYSANIV
jgi:hypothetical protein